MCWPLSRVMSRPSGSVPGTARARPPKVRAASNTVTWWPSRVACTAAAMPAQPAPMTASFMKPAPTSVSHLPQCLHAPGQPELAQGREADALVQHLEVVAFDFAQQGAVDAGHHQ